MIKFNTLILSPNNKTLYVTVSVDPAYEDFYIDQILIDDQESFNVIGPSDDPIYTEFADSNKVFNESEEISIEESAIYLSGKKKIMLALDTSKFKRNVEGNILFVYITTKSKDPNKNGETKMKAVYNGIMMLDSIACKLPEANKNCKIPRDFYNFILNKEALDINLKLGKFNNAIVYFRLINRQISLTQTKCNCYE